MNVLSLIVKLSTREVAYMAIICVVLISIIVVYVFNFGFGLSPLSTDWANFGAYVSGLTVPLLTIANIYVVYKLTIAVENKNRERAIGQKMFESQVIVTQMRMRLYESMRALISEILVDLDNSNDCESKKLDKLRAKLDEVNSSILFADSTGKTSFLKEENEEVKSALKQHDGIREKYFTAQNLIKKLELYQRRMELYIMKQSISDKDITYYISENKSTIDYTLRSLSEE